MGLFNCSRSENDAELKDADGWSKSYLLRALHADVVKKCSQETAKTFAKRGEAIAAKAACVAKLSYNSTCNIFPDDCFDISEISAPGGTQLPKTKPCDGDGNGNKPKPVDDLETSQEGLDLIKEKEGFKPQLYNDSADHCTIGYGTLVHKGPCNGTHTSETPYRNGVDEKKAESLLRASVKSAENAVRDQIVGEMKQHEFDAAVSFVYNLGYASIQKDAARRTLNNGFQSLEKRPDVNPLFSQYSHYRDPKTGDMKWSKGLNDRRIAEGLMYDGQCKIRD